MICAIYVVVWGDIKLWLISNPMVVCKFKWNATRVLIGEFQLHRLNDSLKPQAKSSCLTPDYNQCCHQLITFAHVIMTDLSFPRVQSKQK